MKLLVSTVAPYPWIKLNKQNKPVDKGQFIEAAFISTIPSDVQSVIGVAPADTTTFHQVEVPTRKRSNMLAAVPFAMEDSLSEDIDQLHFTVMDWAPGSPAQVAVLSRQTLEGWLETFTSAGVKLDAIIPEQYLLPVHPDSNATLIRQPDEHYVIKTGLYQGFECDQDAFEYWWSDENNRLLDLAVNDQELAAKLIANGGEHVSHWGVGEDFRGWIEQAPTQLNSAPSLLHGDFEPEHLKPGSSWLNIAAGLAICALLLMASSQWVEASKLKKRYESNQQDIRTLFDEAFPGEEYLDVPRRQIASLLSISEDDPADEIFQYLLEVSVSAAAKNNAELEEVNYRDQQLQFGVSAPNFATLEKLTTQINDLNGLQAALVSSGARDQRVTGQVKIALGGG
jgi:general secretion pathway protein L